jgi:N-terminal acetyltransferase B complex catalytic subunit
MTTFRHFTCDDLFRFNNVNLDPLTETYNLPFYLKYLGKWPEYFSVAYDTCGRMMGYIMGKVEGEGKLWHGHVTAVTVAPEYRRLHMGQKMMNMLEHVSEKVHNAYFVDLYVRVSNNVAVNMYKKFGYTAYRQVQGYYSGEEDAYDMRKPLPRDEAKESIKPLQKFLVTPAELEFD